MPFRDNLRDQRHLVGTLFRWTLLGALVGLLCGGASAVFLKALAWATIYRASHSWLLFLLPIAGLFLAFVYERWGKTVVAGNNLLIDAIHAEDDATAPIPFRLAPMILLGTVVTHLFGGSAGREGTAVQMGGALASALSGFLRGDARTHRILLMAGISGGFGSVFGTPLAGTVFGLEVLTMGTLRYEALIACFVSSCIGDLTCRALGVHHTLYSIAAMPANTPVTWILILLAGILFAGAATAFVAFTEQIGQWAGRFVTNPVLRPVVGGLAVIALAQVLHTRDLLGLSLPLIDRSFRPEGVVWWMFLAKILFTAVTLGTGYKGGEVTPLFVVGATAGSAFAHLTGQPTTFFAALGFVAVFAGAANTPLACTLLGIELFGSSLAVPLMAVCLIAYVLSGHRGIYRSQRIGVSKADGIAIAPTARVDAH